jgi:hypothetical protein
MYFLISILTSTITKFYINLYLIPIIETNFIKLCTIMDLNHPFII